MRSREPLQLIKVLGACRKADHRTGLAVPNVGKRERHLGEPLARQHPQLAALGRRDPSLEVETRPGTGSSDEFAPQARSQIRTTGHGEVVGGDDERRPHVPAQGPLENTGPQQNPGGLGIADPHGPCAVPEQSRVVPVLRLQQRAQLTAPTRLEGLRPRRDDLLPRLLGQAVVEALLLLDQPAPLGNRVRGDLFEGALSGDVRGNPDADLPPPVEQRHQHHIVRQHRRHLLETTGERFSIDGAPRHRHVPIPSVVPHRHRERPQLLGDIRDPGRIVEHHGHLDTRRRRHRRSERGVCRYLTSELRTGHGHTVDDERLAPHTHEHEERLGPVALLSRRHRLVHIGPLVEHIVISGEGDTTGRGRGTRKGSGRLHHPQVPDRGLEVRAGIRLRVRAVVPVPRRVGRRPRRRPHDLRQVAAPGRRELREGLLQLLEGGLRREVEIALQRTLTEFRGGQPDLDGRRPPEPVVRRGTGGTEGDVLGTNVETELPQAQGLLGQLLGEDGRHVIRAQLAPLLVGDPAGRVALVAVAGDQHLRDARPLDLAPRRRTSDPSRGLPHLLDVPRPDVRGAVVEPEQQRVDLLGHEVGHRQLRHRLPAVRPGQGHRTTGLVEPDRRGMVGDQCFPGGSEHLDRPHQTRPLLPEPRCRRGGVRPRRRAVHPALEQHDRRGGIEAGLPVDRGARDDHGLPRTVHGRGIAPDIRVIGRQPQPEAVVAHVVPVDDHRPSGAARPRCHERLEPILAAEEVLQAHRRAVARAPLRLFVRLVQREEDPVGAEGRVGHHAGDDVVRTWQRGLVGGERPVPQRDPAVGGQRHRAGGRVQPAGVPAVEQGLVELRPVAH